jgi:hypothetical protein
MEVRLAWVGNNLNLNLFLNLKLCVVVLSFKVECGIYISSVTKAGDDTAFEFTLCPFVGSLFIHIKREKSKKMLNGLGMRPLASQTSLRVLNFAFYCHSLSN